MRTELALRPLRVIAPSPTGAEAAEKRFEARPAGARSARYFVDWLSLDGVTASVEMIVISATEGSAFC